MKSVSHSSVSDSLQPRGLLSGSSIHGILQAIILEWVAIPFSRRFSWPRDQTWVSCTAGRYFTVWKNLVGTLWKNQSHCSWNTLKMKTRQNIHIGSAKLNQLVRCFQANDPRNMGKKWFLLISYLSGFLNCSKQTPFECFPWHVILNFWSSYSCFSWRQFLIGVTMNNGRKTKEY